MDSDSAEQKLDLIHDTLKQILSALAPIGIAVILIALRLFKII